MKIAFKVNCSNEYNSEAPSYGVVEITPEYAKEILAIEKARADFENALKGISGSPNINNICLWGGNVSYIQTFPDPGKEIGDDLLEEWETLIENLIDKIETSAPEVVELPEDFDIPGYGDGKWEPMYARTECDTILFHGGSITFEAIPKYTNDRVESAFLPMSLFEQIAGKVPA